MREFLVPVPGGDVFVRLWDPGRSERAPILLLHDSLGSVEQWRDFPAALATTTGRTVAAYDRLGFGRSTPRTDAPSFRFIEEEAEVFFPAVVRGLGFEGYVLFGHSVGGAMALTIAAREPGTCRAVITESAQAFVEERTRAGIRAAKLGFESEAQFARLAKWHGERAAWVLRAWTDVWLAPAFEGWSLDACLGRVRCPVLAVHGDADEFGTSAFPRRIAEGVRGPSRMEIVASCGHVPHRERKGEVLRLIRAFLPSRR